MKQYQLLSAYRGWPAGTMLFGPYAITGGGMGYFQKADIPTTDEGGTQCIFASAITSNPLVFNEITQQKTPTNAGAVKK
jgi:hypothetical protein